MFSGMLGSNKNPNHNRYIRLIALSATQISYSLPASLYILYFDAHVLTLFPWISWENTHFNYSRVDQIPSIIWRSSPTQTIIEVLRWNTVLSAFLFFAYFGFAEEAQKHYRIVYSFASSSLRLPDLRKSGASSSPPYTPSSSFGGGFKKGVVSFFSSKDSFSTLESRGKFENVTERKDSFLVSEYRLTSSASIFEGVDHTAKVLALLPDEDDFKLAPNSQSAVGALPVSIPPPPIAHVSVRIVPLNRLNSPLPHRPTSSDLYRDASKKV
jgi:pheromone a factor receptor